MTAGLDVEAQIGCPEAEQAFLGALLLLPVVQAAGLLVEPEDLTDPRGRVVLDAVRRLVNRGVRPDPVLVVEELRTAGQLGAFTAGCNAGVFVAELVEACAVPASGGYYRKALLEHALRRRVVEAATRLAQGAEYLDVDSLARLVGAQVVEVYVMVRRLDAAGVTP